METMVFPITHYHGGHDMDEMLVIYEDEHISAAVALIRRDISGYSYELVPFKAAALPYNRKQVALFVRKMIEAPLELYRMRHRTMPDLFEELVPGSEEHFRRLRMKCGPFRLVRQ